MNDRNFKKELLYFSYIDMEEGRDTESIDYESLITIIQELHQRIEKLERWKSRVQKAGAEVSAKMKDVHERNKQLVDKSKEILTKTEELTAKRRDSDERLDKLQDKIQQHIERDDRLKDKIQDYKDELKRQYRNSLGL